MSRLFKLFKKIVKNFTSVDVRQFVYNKVKFSDGMSGDV